MNEYTNKELSMLAAHRAQYLDEQTCIAFESGSPSKSRRYKEEANQYRAIARRLRDYDKLLSDLSAAYEEASGNSFTRVDTPTKQVEEG